MLAILILVLAFTMIVIARMGGRRARIAMVAVYLLAVLLCSVIPVMIKQPLFAVMAVFLTLPGSLLGAYLEKFVPFGVGIISLAAIPLGAALNAYLLWRFSRPKAQ